MMDLLDVHTHSLASGHAYSTMKEMAEAAASKGIKLLGITEHAPNMPGSCHLFYFENLHVVPKEMSGVELLLGSEVNICGMNGELDLEDRVLEKLDLCIASIHPPCFKSGTPKENTNAVIQVMKNPYISIIGHPDDSRIPLEYEELVRAAKETNTILELNNSSVGPKAFRVNSKENVMTMLMYCRKYEVPVIMSSDAHVAQDVGRHNYVQEIVESVGFPQELIMNDKPELPTEMVAKKRQGK